MSALQPENYRSQLLVDMRGDFIDWKKRRAGENGWLVKILQKHGCTMIFDASLGDGADSISLLHSGFQVTSNDLDPLFIAKAQENAQKENMQLTVTQYDRREIDKHFSPQSFDAVCCLGNSLTYLFGREDQLTALRNFHTLLKHG